MFSIFKRKPKLDQDDTFKALRGYTYEEVEAALFKEFKKQDRVLSFAFYAMIISDNDAHTEHRDKVLKKHNWTFAQFVEESRKRPPITDRYS